METQIFYWTGFAIWAALCLASFALVLTLTVIGPIILYRKMCKYFWQWKWAAVAASTGLEAHDVAFALRVPGGTPGGLDQTELIAWFKRVKERGDAIKAQKEDS